MADAKPPADYTLLNVPARRYAVFTHRGPIESFEFLRPARSLAAAWEGLGLETRNTVVPGANHFSVPAGLADPHSNMTRRIVELAG